MTVVRVSRRTIGPLVPTGFNDKEIPWIHEQRLAPLGPSQCVVADRAGSDRVVGRVASVTDLIVSLSDPTELGSPCGKESDLYRLDNGLHVVSGLGLCGHADRPSLAVFRALSDGAVTVERRAEVSQTSPVHVLPCEPVGEPSWTSTCRADWMFMGLGAMGPCLVVHMWLYLG